MSFCEFAWLYMQASLSRGTDMNVLIPSKLSVRFHILHQKCSH
ncbi:Uncharacterised protein [Vibrio cholerae]|nr:Uncharacterised protein [Vibrio cholerae]